MTLRALVANTYKSVRVVGRGTVMIAPAEVYACPHFKAARELAQGIVRGRHVLDDNGDAEAVCRSPKSITHAEANRK